MLNKGHGMLGFYYAPYAPVRIRLKYVKSTYSHLNIFRRVSGAFQLLRESAWFYFIFSCILKK